MSIQTSIFKEGAISPEFIAKCITELQSEIRVGGHDIFLGQVRADELDGKKVGAIVYTAYEEMANKKAQEIAEQAVADHGLSSLQIYHSLGEVKAGEICLFVFASAPHRKEVFTGLNQAVEALKAELPVFGKEVWSDASSTWKVNQ